MRNNVFNEGLNILKSFLFSIFLLILFVLMMYFGFYVPAYNAAHQPKTWQTCDISGECAEVLQEDIPYSFKENYERLNGQKTSSGKTYREVNIPEDHPFVESTPEEIVKIIEEGRTFYVYIGDEMCPWCRSVIEEAIASAKRNNVDKIYSLEIWDDKGNEMFRDKYVAYLYTGENMWWWSAVPTGTGTEAYHSLLKYWDEYLEEYIVANKSGNITLDTEEKRIYAPTFVYVENGNIKKLTTGISQLQEDPNGELTEEILQQERFQFDYFFSPDLSSGAIRGLGANY